jgi:hypothetical protein
MTRSRWVLSISSIIGGLMWANADLLAGPFCYPMGPTLSEVVSQSSMVLVGTVENARRAPHSDRTDLRIESVIKSDPILRGRKVITLPVHVPAATYLVFCDVYYGMIDPSGIIKADSDLLGYLRGALALREKTTGERMRYFFNFLDSANLEISNDAYNEFYNAEYKDYREMARQLPPDKIVKWLKDSRTPALRLGLYASLLGACGTASHAAVLKELLTDPSNDEVRLSAAGILAGYIMLQPREGWALVTSLIEDKRALDATKVVAMFAEAAAIYPATAATTAAVSAVVARADLNEFMLRYTALLVIRFLKESRPDLVSKADFEAAMQRLLAQADIAELAIEDLRKSKDRSLLDQILVLYDQKSHDVPMIKRAIVAFALTCPEPKAAAFAKALRKKDPEMVRDVEEMLRIEPSIRPGCSAGCGPR